jgi:hypothetical protein
MKLSPFFTKGLNVVKSNSPEILTALGVSGVLTTAYLAGKASYKVAQKLESAPADLPFKEKALRVWKLYIPTGISGTVTIGCIVASSRATGRRTTAAVTAYSLTERAFSEYRENVVKEIGKGKEQRIRDGIAQEHVSLNPPTQEVIVLGNGHVLCCELYTHRYFRSDMETIRKAQNDLNARIVSAFYVTLDEFYDLIGLPHTSASNNLGWDSDKLMELEFSTVVSESGEPCLAFDYNYIKPLK